MKLSAREYDGGTYHVYEGESENLVALMVGDHCTDEKLAKLMASAPELLDVVQSYYKELADIRNQWPGRHTLEGQAKLCMLRDLIAQATGRFSQEVQAS